MNEISRAKILEVKPSGNYSCPNFIPPQIACEIAESAGKKLDTEASKALAEIAENFAGEVLKCCDSNQPTAGDIVDVLRTAKLV